MNAKIWRVFLLRSALFSTLFLTTLCPPTFAGSWTGPYAGLSLGYGDASDAWDQAASPGNAKITPEGFAFGGFAGYQYEIGGLILGLEGDLTFSDFSDAAECADPNFNCSVDVQFLTSLRARSGIAVGQLQLYGTGGIALGYIQAESSVLGGLSDSATLIGWTLGTGAEYQIEDRYRVGIEYRHSDYGDAAVTLGGASDGDVRLSTDEVRLRLSIPLN